MIIFCGDLYLSEQKISFDGAILDLFSAASYVVANFENVLLNPGLPKRKNKNVILAFSQEALENYLNLVNVKQVFLLGNNHVNDLGGDGINHTKNLLATFNNVLCCGAGLYKDVAKPLIISDDKIRIGLLPVSTDEPEAMSVIADDTSRGVLSYDDCAIVDIIEEYKNEVNYFIVVPHWGKEFLKYPAVHLRYIAHRWIDAGADLVIGHHPHVVQGKEQYREKWIYYSLGNFVFSNFYDQKKRLYRWRKENNHSIALSISFHDSVEIKEIGLYFDTSKFLLKEDIRSVNQLKMRSTALEIENISEYYEFWENGYYRHLKRRYSMKDKLIRKMANLLSRSLKQIDVGRS